MYCSWAYNTEMKLTLARHYVPDSTVYYISAISLSGETMIILGDYIFHDKCPLVVLDPTSNSTIINLDYAGLVNLLAVLVMSGI